MIMRLGTTAFAALLATSFALPTMAQTAPTAITIPPKYKNFRAAIYIAVGDARRLADRATFDRQYARAASQLHFDKVYIEAYRDRDFATDDELERVKSYFAEKGIATAGGITLAAGGEGGQFGTFDYEKPADRAECEKAVRLAARHFDEVILDDFFFYTSKSDADIAAKGKQSWTQYRLETMRKVSRDLVLAPAHAVNPRVKMVIKYPNWYEHFQGLGYDLDQQAQAFDGIYTGTETRDPTLTDQLLQQYESYGIIRYYGNIRPGGNGGGWVDTFSTRDLDRYAEQLWDTLFAKAPEITLFNWHPMSEDAAAEAGQRPWANAQTSFDWEAEQRRWRASGARLPAGWGRAAGYALETVDSVLGELGQPIGIASYKPYQSSGEDFLHNYLGTIGLPIELSPHFPEAAKTMLLTEAAAADPMIVAKIQRALKRGATVIVTSGLVEKLQDRGFRDLAEWVPTGRRVLIDQFVQGYGAGNGTPLNATEGTQKPILFPDIRFYTNDSWAIVRGVAGAKGFPLILMNRYSAGTLYMLTVPENPADLYAMPPAMLAQIRKVASSDMPVMIEAPAHVSLFAYDNDTFVVQSFRGETTPVAVHAAGRQLVELPSGTIVSATAPIAGSATAAPDRADFALTLPPHSFRVFRIVR
ncbi:hypothetical protein H3Z74_12375 [Sphingomonas alpina]|uniref:Uncharacterized protein n=2 Tax=Sphingomonas alpina TaxID=653931 RepID=A0A7H0LD70_9SPHN|nr:hypothetical protein H3Z74_12375 [Sphingomonas alpina]